LKNEGACYNGGRLLAKVFGVSATGAAWSLPVLAGNLVDLEFVEKDAEA
jgi:hypothetical protein